MKKKTARDMELGPEFIENITVKTLKLWIGKVSGIKNMPKDRGFIIAPNHCSYIEHFLIGSLVVPYIKKKIYILAKKEHFGDFTQRRWHSFWSKYIGQIPIDRSKGEDALMQAADCLKKGKVLIIYPEGTRSLNGKLQKGKTGIARLVLDAKVPVLPVGSKGTFEILPKGKYIPRLKRATINIGKLMYFDKYHNRKITKTLLREITDDIMKEIARLSDQKYKY